MLCEAPAALTAEQCRELFALAREKGCILMEGIKTAYSTAYYRLLLLAKSGQIGRLCLWTRPVPVWLRTGAAVRSS